MGHPFFRREYPLKYHGVLLSPIGPGSRICVMWYVLTARAEERWVTPYIICFTLLCHWCNVCHSNTFKRHPNQVLVVRCPVIKRNGRYLCLTGLRP